MEFGFTLKVEPGGFAGGLDGCGAGWGRRRRRKEERKRQMRERARETERYFRFWSEPVEGQRSCLLK